MADAEATAGEQLHGLHAGVQVLAEGLGQGTTEPGGNGGKRLRAAILWAMKLPMGNFASAASMENPEKKMDEKRELLVELLYVRFCVK